MQEPQVTTIIPVHNHEKWVMQAINSIVNSSYRKNRIIVINDGSSDSSYQVVLDSLKDCQKVTFPKNDEPKSIYRGSINGIGILAISFHKAYGPSFARNYGIKTAWDGTDLFALLDSDDYYEPTKIEESINVWLKAPGVIGIVYSDYSTFGPDGIFHRQFKEPFSYNRLKRECIINCDSVFSKIALEKCGLFPEEMRVAEDYFLYSKILKNFVAFHLPLDLLKIRIGHHSSTSTVPKEVWETCYRKAMESLYS